MVLAAPASGATTPPLEQLARGPETGEPCADRTYPECRRLRYFYGPLVVTPGNNAQLFGPVTIEKPLVDGYVLRIRPDLVRADGTPPPTEQVHLHHGTWLNISRRGLDPVPFFASGEEKTIAQMPPGYGSLIKASELWAINYMLHNGTATPEVLWLAYDIDFVPREAAERRGITNVESLWLDVFRGTNRAAYPVFNVLKGLGTMNRRTGERECAYPRDECAPVDPWGEPQRGNGKGWDFTVPPELAGTLVFTAGHVHPGGLRTELSVVRNVNGEERERRIFTSEARYFDPNGPVSWDMAMTATDSDWRVRVQAGDKLRLNGVYETDRASWYEGMAIMMAAIAPGDESGVDPFATVRVRKRVRAPRRGARRRAGVRCRRVARSRGSRRPRRVRRVCFRVVRRPVPIDLNGEPTHGHLPENDNYGGERVRPLPAQEGPELDRIGIGYFRYSAGDLSSVDGEGIPRVRLGSRLTFSNYDAFAGIWHTITTCKPPCTGATGISYPIADDDSRLDSLELGYAPQLGPLLQPVAQTHEYSIEPERDGLRAGSTYTYFCRIHPFMRGAFKVVP